MDTTENSEQATTDAVAADNSTTVQDTGEDTTQPTAADGTPNEEIQSLHAELEKMRAENRKLKDESAERRVTAREAKEQAAKLRQVAQALGFEAADDDPEAMLKAAQAEAQLDELGATDTLRTLARKTGANPNVLIPYLKGTGKLPKWGEDDFDDKAEKIIANTLTTLPMMRANMPAQSSGGTPTPTKQQGQITAADPSKLPPLTPPSTCSSAVSVTSRSISRLMTPTPPPLIWTAGPAPLRSPAPSPSLWSASSLS
ncbi:hypothetical protein [Corynebacterium sp.]|uniref:hypothetical protein n=1 Tax=Corynebacterium sp. TaxID=1720 RepID=UPI0026DBDD90|nr:hypothetical protein [Corynebacterium sp.]MDO5032053.1 hypothetical protein [Corynebacterium sp.]